MTVDSELAAALHRAIENQAIWPVFQPIVHLSTRKISSFEVLARWTDPDFGVVSPATFIPVLEDLELIESMTGHLIRVACSAMMPWQGDFRLTFNISPVHFQDGAMPLLLEDAVLQTGFPLYRTQIEITESALLKDVDAARATMETLRSKGVQVLLDDFGTRYSSLERLRALPFDKIKIDASFIGVIESSRESRKIVAAVIGLGQSLGVPVIAEGVETELQEQILRHFGCDLVQGWRYSRPVPAADVPALLNSMGQASWDLLPKYFSINQRLAQLEVLYSLAPVGICFVDIAFHVLRVNEKWLLLLGLDMYDPVGHDIRQSMPQVADFAVAALEAAQANTADLSQILRLADGSECELTVAATRDEVDDLIGLSLMIFPHAGAY